MLVYEQQSFMMVRYGPRKQKTERLERNEVSIVCWMSHVSVTKMIKY